MSGLHLFSFLLLLTPFPLSESPNLVHKFHGHPIKNQPFYVSLLNRRQSLGEGGIFACGHERKCFRVIVEDIKCHTRKALESQSLCFRGKFGFPCVCPINAGTSHLLMSSHSHKGACVFHSLFPTLVMWSPLPVYHPTTKRLMFWFLRTAPWTFSYLSILLTIATSPFCASVHYI